MKPPSELHRFLTEELGLTRHFTPPDWEQYEQEMFARLYKTLPPFVQRTVAKLPRKYLEEIVLEVGQPPTYRVNGVEYYDTNPSSITTPADIDHIRSKLATRIKPNGRAGIEGTLHRFSVRRSSDGRDIGFTIRIARAIPGIAEPLRPILKGPSSSLLIIGPPGVGKTTLLRDVARILSEVHGRRAAIIDTSGEIAGEGATPHPIIGFASRFAVPDPREQAKFMLQAVANHSPRVIVIDEISTREEAEVVLQFGRKGVDVVSSIHGYSLLDAVENPAYYPLLGIPEDRNPLRQTAPLYQSAIEITGIGRARLRVGLEEHIRGLLEGNESGEIKEIVFPTQGRGSDISQGISLVKK